MEIKTIASDLSVSRQIQPQDFSIAASQGFRSVIVNRPDGEGDDQPSHHELEEAAKNHGMELRYIPVKPGEITNDDVTLFRQALLDLPAPTIAFCRTGKRSASLWALSQAGHLSTEAILKTTAAAGYDLSGLGDQIANKADGVDQKNKPSKNYDVVIIGGGAGGITAASGLLKRRRNLSVAIIEPNTEHYYQPGWTMVGGGVFKRDQTRRDMESLIPSGAIWHQAACAGFQPEHNQITLEDGERIGYKVLVVAPGLKLNWDGVEGLKDTLGKNGVTSNYLFDMAPYTWDLVSNLKSGRALFTQPLMPIKCAGAPQKAMYLACDDWRRRGVLKDIDVNFHSAIGVLFGVADYVPALMEYIKKYNANLHFNEKLVAVDGTAKTATFEFQSEDGKTTRRTDSFDMLHVCPPQAALDFVANSPLANETGWVDINGETLQHNKYGNIFGLGDAGSTPNAKTAAAVRKQAPVVAHNILCVLDGRAPTAVYNGYGSCPLTVERGKIVLAEFCYGGKLDPSFPSWFLDGTKPTWRAWFLKEKMLPYIYFDMMLRGNETMAKPTILKHRPTVHEAQDACDYNNKGRKKDSRAA